MKWLNLKLPLLFVFSANRHENVLIQRGEMKKEVWEYSNSPTKIMFGSPPYNLMQILDGVDLDDNINRSDHTNRSRKQFIELS